MTNETFNAELLPHVSDELIAGIGKSKREEYQSFIRERLDFHAGGEVIQNPTTWGRKYRRVVRKELKKKYGFDPMTWVMIIRLVLAVFKFWQDRRGE